MWPFTRRRVRESGLDRLPLCRLPAPLDLNKAGRVLVFAPHPEDESLGCGGTLALLATRSQVKVVLVTDGNGAGGLPEGADRLRQEEFKAALSQLGVEHFELLGYPDGAFESDPIIERRLSKLIATYQPDWVFLPSPLDYHRDHVRISVMLEPLCRRCKTVTHLLFYEIWAPVPATHVVDITEVVGMKRLAIDQHRTALACGDYLRAVEGLNRYRGLYLGHDRLAEAFWVEPVGKRSLFGRVRDFSLSLMGQMADEPAG